MLAVIGRRSSAWRPFKNHVKHIAVPQCAVPGRSAFPPLRNDCRFFANSSLSNHPRTFPNSFREAIEKPPVGRQVAFVFGVTGLAYLWAATASNNDMERWSHKLGGTAWWRGGQAPTSEEMRRARHFELGRYLQAELKTLKDKLANLPNTLSSVIVYTYVAVAQPYLNSFEGRRVCWQICAFNGLVWLAWQMRRLQPVMLVRFVHNPLSGLSYTLLTSMFSHKNIIHLAFNGIALASFGAAVGLYLTQEQDRLASLPESSVNYHLVAYLIGAGLFSGLVSHLVSARVKFPRLVRSLSTPQQSLKPSIPARTAESTKSEILPSLGISGAAYAAMVTTALAFPDTDIALIILPSFPIPIAWGVSGVVLFDILGILRGWKFLDHWAHLGGAAFGAIYYRYGPAWWSWLRTSLYHSSRKSAKQ